MVRRGEDREHNKVAGEEWESGGGGEGEQWGRGGKGDLTFMEVEVQGTLEGLWGCGSLCSLRPRYGVWSTRCVNK